MAGIRAEGRITLSLKFASKQTDRHRAKQAQEAGQA